MRGPKARRFSVSEGQTATRPFRLIFEVGAADLFWKSRCKKEAHSTPSGRFNNPTTALAKELHDGHADQHIAVEDEYGLYLRRLAVAVGTVHARILPLSTTDRGVVAG